MKGRRRRRWSPVPIAAVALGLGIAVGGLFLALRLQPAHQSPTRSPAPASSAPAPDPTSGAPAPAPTSTRVPLDDPPDPGPAPDHHDLDPAQLSAAVASSVRVTGPACRGIVREGSGFAVLDGDVIVTNAHLMVGMDEPTVELADGRTLAAVPVAIDATNDLAVLRAEGAGLEPLPLTEAVPDGTVGAVMAWEDEALPDPTPFRIDRPITVRTEAAVGDELIERPSWLLAADIELGDSGAALVAPVEGRLAALGVVWSASRRGGVDVAYATRAGAVVQLLASSDLVEPVQPPDCG